MKALHALETFDTERCKKHRTGAGAAKATVNRGPAGVSRLLDKALEWRWIRSKSVRIARFKEDNQQIVYLTDDQCAAWLAAAAADRNENIHGFVMVGLHSGMRHQEIAAIRVSDVDLEKRVIWLRKAKAGVREQPATRELADCLADRMSMLPPGCEWPFPFPQSATGHVHTIRKAFRRAATAAGHAPDQITPHVARHTAVTYLVQAQADVPTVQRISGHNRLAKVARDAHRNGEQIEAAIGRLQERVGSNQQAAVVEA